MHARLSDTARARASLDAALALAAPEGCVGLCADLGPPMAELLGQRAARSAQDDPAQGYLRRLPAAFPAGAGHGRAVEGGAPASHPAPEHGHTSREALTEREREVLRLFAAGLTSAEIAQQFVVSVNTVKTQLKSIYSKLDTHSRAELVARARALNLIP